MVGKESIGSLIKLRFYSLCHWIDRSMRSTVRNILSNPHLSLVHLIFICLIIVQIYATLINKYHCTVVVVPTKCESFRSYLWYIVDFAIIANIIRIKGHCGSGRGVEDRIGEYTVQ